MLFDFLDNTSFADLVDLSYKNCKFLLDTEYLFQNIRKLE